MLNLGVPWWELILRSAIVYAALLLILRMTGKRAVGQLAPFDLVLCSCFRTPSEFNEWGDNSLIGGLISACTHSLNYAVGEAAFETSSSAIIEGDR